jgi:general secretion pathway protein D
MFHPFQSRGQRWPSLSIAASLIAILIVASSLYPACAQTSSPSNSPASVPAGAIPPVPRASRQESNPAAIRLSPKQAREADDAYLAGARHIGHKDLAAAERSFEQAVRLSPDNRDYALALIVTRENYVTELVQNAAKAGAHGDTAGAEALLAQARAIDPDNRVVAQHFDIDSTAAAASTKNSKGPGLFYSSIDPLKFPAQDIASTLSGPIELAPLANKLNIHLHGDPQSVIRNLYSLYGITVTFDPSVTGGAPIDLDLDNVAFADAARVLDTSAHTFAIPVQAKAALIVKDTPENRDALMPQVEETIYLPGRTNDEMQELANLARNIFDVKQITASATGGYLLLRGDEQVLHEVNAVYDDMLDGGSEVLFDVTLYELDKTSDNNIGLTLPASAGVFDLITSAQNLITSNQSLINQAIAGGLLTLTGSVGANELAELAFLVAAGVSGSAQFTSLLGTLGTYDSLPLLGVSLAAGTTFNMALNSTDVRILDHVEIRSSNHQPVNFRAGTRYPVVTATYSSGISSSLTSKLSGLNINGTSVSSLLSQYLGSSNVSVPQFQFEDLGITLKMTPQILHGDEVYLPLEMKIEALAGSSINSIPILNNRALTSTVTVPAGQTAMLAMLVDSSETKALTGLPGLSELPGFQGTDQDRQKSSTELLITITPHIVRNGRLQISSRRLATVRTGQSPVATPAVATP